ncbi:MAG TPA: helix-turn-helix domain-containing protein [Vicinamibacterales bacterium]|nr:helix-turn-helix domain-containing protein [Vicinamibacterales bacterium]
MPDSLGARLRQRREEQKIDLRTVAADTKIKLSLLEALERDDVSRWPAGIFRRAYVRAYAQAIGLDPDLVVRQFLEAHPDGDEALSIAAVSAVVAESEQAAAPRGASLRGLVGSALGSLSRLRRHPLPERSLEGPPDEGDTRPAVERETPSPAAAADRALPHEHVNTARPPLDLAALARLCTEFGRVDSAEALKPLLRQGAALLDATGLILWVWDPAAGGLRAALAHGYSDRVLAHLPAVPPEAENATAAAFRTGRPCTAPGNEHTSGALVVPLLTREGCAGALALELAGGREQAADVQAAATILAALLAQLTAPAPAVAAPDEDTPPQVERVSVS